MVHILLLILCLLLLFVILLVLIPMVGLPMVPILLTSLFVVHFVLLYNISLVLVYYARLRKDLCFSFPMLLLLCQNIFGFNFQSTVDTSIGSFVYSVV